MSQVAFWRYRQGQTDSTANLIAVATLISMEYVIRTLISHTHWAQFSMESAFIKRDAFQIHEKTYDNIGLDALERLARSQLLTTDKMKDYTDTILRERLEFLRGTSNPNEELFASMEEVMPYILGTARGYYHLTLTDVSSGTRNKLTKTVLSASDVIVVNLNQNIAMLDEFFEAAEKGDFNDKPHILVLGQYDRYSKYSVSNIKRMFNPKFPIFTVPYCTGYMDALNDKTVVEFFVRNKYVRRGHDHHYFMSEVRKLARGILDACGIDTKAYSEQGAS